MFCGIVETIGCINQIEIMNGCKTFTIAPHQPFHDLKTGDSVAVNGVCLTITHFNAHEFSITAVPETLRLTNLADLTKGQCVNLERAMQFNQRIGGHLVQGHVDGMGEIIALQHDQSDAWIVKISMPRELQKYLVKKGFITLDGMSITLIDVTSEWFTVTLIPHTQSVTISKQYRVGSHINIEVDMMGKYIEKLIGAYQHAHIS